MAMIRIFRYIDALDAFVVTEPYRQIADQLGLSEWNPVVWIGRLFTLDNDYGEHWFDNWEAMSIRADKARQLNIDPDQLLVIDPDRLKNDVDGPVNAPELRKQFWTDVLKSLELSYETLVAEARRQNAFTQPPFPEDFIPDLEDRIERLRPGPAPTAELAAERISSDRPSRYTQIQGRYLAFIYYYTRLHGCPPAEADIQRHFKVASPSVHQMILTLERRGLIARSPGQARTIRVMLPREELPELE